MTEEFDPTKHLGSPETNLSLGATRNIDSALIEEAIHSEVTQGLPVDPTRRFIQTDDGNVVMEVQKFLIRVQEIRVSLIEFLRQRNINKRSELLGYIAIFTPTIEVSLRAIKLVSQREYVFLSFINEALKPIEGKSFDEEVEGMYRLSEYVKQRLYDLVKEGKISEQQFKEDFELITLIATIYSKAIPELT